MASAFGVPPGIVCGTVTSYGDATFISPSHLGPRVYSGFTLTTLWMPVMWYMCATAWRPQSQLLGQVTAVVMAVVLVVPMETEASMPAEAMSPL